MNKGEIRFRKIIVHILDSTLGIPALSDSILDFGSDFGDFLREHIYRLMTGDDKKTCEFHKEESLVYQQLQRMMETEIGDEVFVEVSQNIASHLYEIMNKNIDIPPADFVEALFETDTGKYLALLKMNYKTSYTHQTQSGALGNVNEIIKFRAVLPSESQKLSEAAIVNLSDFSVFVTEKKYEINGEKTNYFSKLFLNCSGALSPKTQLTIVTRAIDAVQKKYFHEGEQFEVQMEAKQVIHNQLAENGIVDVPFVLDEVFKEKDEFKEEVNEKLEKYKMGTDIQIEPQAESTARKFAKQHLATDTGVEIKIPMEQYQDGEHIEFITNPDGSLSILIKNVGHITAK
ncbi:MAG: nucleoid-associated protein [Lachnospiraceae bacterium]|nr:nucleoid-associated protein [Lachnospiraceae bacterium]